MLKIRRPLGRLIFNMGITIPGKTVFLIETGPWMPVFWGYPPPSHDYPYYWPVHIGSWVHTIEQFILDPKSKQDKVKVTNLKNLPKLQIFEFWKKNLYATQFLKLLDKVCKDEMDTASIVEDTEQTRFCPQMDKRTDRRTEAQTRWNQYTPLQLCWVW